MNLRTNEITQLVESYNAAEIEIRRDYYDYLQSQEPQTESFEEHLQQYADLIRTGDTATANEVAALETTVGVTFPEELRELYATIGMLRAGGPEGRIDLFSVRELTEKAQKAAAPHPLGLVKMILDCWGEDRFEFNPSKGLISADQIARLDAEYTCIGWIWTDRSLESHEYIYFDRAGNFGTLFYHQDAFDQLYNDSLLPMLEASPAKSALSEIILKALPAEELATDDLDEDEE
jgi:hypothetical protein